MPDRPFENAYWIWDDGDPRPVNAYRYFRKVFTIQDDWPEKPVLRIAADTQYKLYIKGSWVAAGSAPSARSTIAYDEFAVAAAPGDEICIAAIVHYIGVPTFSRFRNRAGLIVELGSVVTDETWEVATVSQYLPNAPRWSPMLGFSDVFDGSLWPRGFPEWSAEWKLDEPYASQWRRATVVEKSYEASWPVMLPAPPLSERHSLEIENEAAAKLIEYGNCIRGLGEGAAERTTNDVCLPLTSGKVQPDDSKFGFGYKVEADEADVFLTFDFGRQVSGYPLIAYRLTDDFDGEDAYIDIAYDEALHPGETPSGLRTYEGRYDRNFADQFLVKPHSTYEYISSTPRSFRYLRLVLRNIKAEIILEQPLLVEPRASWISPSESLTAHGNRSIELVRLQSSFYCSDPRLDSIFEVGKRTLELCMDDQFMDTPMRERAQYIGDARIQAIGARYAFGDATLHARFLRQVALSQYEDGRIDPVGPGEWDALEPNKPIPGYVAIYILSVLDYYQMTGDGTLVQEVMPAVLQALGWLGSYGGGEGGLLISLPGWNFTDWAPGLDQGTDGINAAVNLFYLMALQAASRLAQLSGDEAAARSHGLRANTVSAAFDSLFWNAIRGVYVDSVIEGEQSPLASQQVNSLALLAEVGSVGRRESIAERLLRDSTLTQTGTPYFAYYLVQALASAGRETQALSYIRERWGAMLDAGATAWWETWDGLQSRCHGWSIAPSIWLPQHVLGVTAHEPGFATVNIAPKLCGLTWARGIVPIPQGDVQVSWLRKGHRLTVDATVPTGVLLRPILPCGPGDEIIIDGQSAREDQIVRRKETAAEIAVLPGSGYRFEVVSGPIRRNDHLS